MTQNEINEAVFKASAKGFQRGKTLRAKYGIEAAGIAMDAAGERGRMRVYGPQGGVGPGR